LQAQVRGLQQASRNANNAISLVQTAEGALNSVTNILQRLRELAVQAASDDNTDTDRTALNNESKQLRDELTRLANTVEFNGTTLLDGGFTGKKFQIGSNANQTLTFEIADARATALGGFATKVANIGDGASQGVAGGGALSADEFKINGTSVLTTSDSDDQLSILGISSASGFSTDILSGTTGIADSIQNNVLNINGTEINFAGLSLAYTNTVSGAASVVIDLASIINAASITNVRAVIASNGNVSTFLVLEATAGTNIVLYGSGNGVATAAGFASVLVGLGISAAFAGVGSAAAVTTYNGQSSSIAKAAAVNGIKGTTGVTATVESNAVTLGTTVASGTILSGELQINGVNLGAISVSTNDSDGALVAAINAQSSSTGVKASVSGGALTLTAADGRNITVFGGGTTQTILGNSGKIAFNGLTGIVRGDLTLTSTKNFTLSGTTSDIGSIAATTYVATGNLSTLAITSRSAANTAITQIDSALDTINNSRSSIGAVQSRLTTAIEFLDNAAENQSASESRIRDADFALETSKFTRGQILVQAATAILAQANNQPQIALQLLQ